MESIEPQKVYVDINPDCPVSEIESVCVNCQDNGITRLLLTKIPFFKDIIIMAFTCDKCGYRSNEVQPASSLADYGIKFELKIVSERDLSRRIVKTEYAEIKVPACDLEIPPLTQKGKLSTIEGFLSCARDQLKEAFETGVYDTLDEATKGKITATIEKINKVLDLSALPITLTLEDPSGNSFIENPFAPNRDVYCKTTHFIRTKEMAEQMGYSLENQEQESKSTNVISTGNKGFEVYKSNSYISAHLMDMTKSVEENEGQDAIIFPEECMVCHKMGNNRICVISIPFFKELIISCFTCDHCTFKSTEIKGGGGISEKGSKITVNCKTPKDLNRDLFKSETSQIIIPELNFESSMGSLGSMFTTVEGLLDKITSNIRDTPFSCGDSSDTKNFDEFIAKLEGLCKDKFFPFTLILDDPISNSFVFSVNHENPDNDKDMKIEIYDRTWEQNEELGLNDMKVENYEVTEESKKKLEDLNKID